MRAIVLFLLLIGSVYAADDYVIGKYEYMDKLTVEGHIWTVMEVEGEGKYVAGFIETFYDNLSGAYREKPELRAKVLEQMAEARKSGKKSFLLTQDRYRIAFQETTGEW